jgi:hypothetical protein
MYSIQISRDSSVTIVTGYRLDYGLDSLQSNRPDLLYSLCGLLNNE